MPHLPAVLGEHAPALVGAQQVPLVAAHERVHGEPLLGLDAPQEAGHVRLVELGVAVHAHRVPRRQQRAEQARTANLADGPLQPLGRRAVQPQHHVGVGAQPRHVVDAAEGDVLVLDEVDDVVELAHEAGHVVPIEVVGA